MSSATLPSLLLQHGRARPAPPRRAVPRFRVKPTRLRCVYSIAASSGATATARTEANTGTGGKGREGETPAR